MSSTLKVDILQDSGGNNLVTSNGSGVITAAGFGKIGQVVQETSSSQFLVSTPTQAQVYYPSANKLSLNITPSSTSSKILVSFISTCRVKRDSGSAGDIGVAMSLKQTIDGTATEFKPDSNAFDSGFYINEVKAAGGVRPRLHETILISPATTDEITYEVGVYSYGAAGSGGEMRLNSGSSEGRIQAMEILP